MSRKKSTHNSRKNPKENNVHRRARIAKKKAKREAMALAYDSQDRNNEKINAEAVRLLMENAELKASTVSQGIESWDGNTVDIHYPDDGMGVSPQGMQELLAGPDGQRFAESISSLKGTAQEPTGVEKEFEDAIPFKDYHQALEDEKARHLKFKGAQSKEEYRDRQKVFRDDGFERTVFDDRILQNRWTLVKEDALGLDCADILFSAMRTKENNANLMPNIKERPGSRDDYAHLYREDGRKDSHAYMMHLLNKCSPFAFPAWWFAEARMLWHIHHLHDDTHDYPYRYPMHDPKDLMSEQAKWFRTLAGKEDAFSTIAERKVRRNLNVGYPDKTPFSTTFVALEDVDDMLIYQRSKNQVDMVRDYSAPTTAYSPDGNPVPLDFIYCAGFLFCKDVRLQMHGANGTNLLGSMIWGIYHGYVISKEHCPNDMDFLRIPMLCPIYIQKLGDTLTGDGEKNHIISGPVDLMRKSDWIQPDTDLAAPLNHLMQAIDDHSIVQVQFSGAQKRQKRNMKAREGIDVRQRRYSRVQMHGGVVMPSQQRRDGESQGLLPKWTLDHRVNCREHDRCYIRRGRLPISGDERELLERRKYTIYTDNKDISPHDARRLNRRKVEWPNDVDWVAIRTIRIPEHEKGPEGKKVIPIIRVPKAEVIADSLEYELSDPLKAV